MSILKQSEISSLLEEKKMIALENLAIFPFAQHPKFSQVLSLAKKWTSRFSNSFTESVYNEISVLFSFLEKSFLDQHDPRHLFHLALYFSHATKKLLQEKTLIPDQRHHFIKLLPTELIYSFSYKPILGCLIGVTLKNPEETCNFNDTQKLIEVHIS